MAALVLIQGMPLLAGGVAYLTLWCICFVALTVVLAEFTKPPMRYIVLALVLAILLPAVTYAVPIIDSCKVLEQGSVLWYLSGCAL